MHRVRIVRGYPEPRRLPVGTQPPKISPSISFLLRQTQRVLSQLCSGFSSELASYKAMVGMSTPSICPDCSGAEQATALLFTYPSHPAQLTFIDLRTNPIRAATSLSSTPFSDLSPYSLLSSACSSSSSSSSDSSASASPLLPSLSRAPASGILRIF